MKTLLTEIEKMAIDGGIGLAQIHSIAGDLEYNSNKIIEYINKATTLKLDIIAFPRNALLGFNMPDFISRYPFITDEITKYLTKIALKTQNTACLIDFQNRDNSSSFAILRNGKIEQILENTEYITSKLFHDGAEFYIKPTSSPSLSGSDAKREETLKDSAQHLNRTVLEINQVGSTDGWSYAGISCACDEKGNIFARAKSFEEQLLIVNPYKKIGEIYSSTPTKKPANFSLDYEWDLERTYKSIIQTIRDYFNSCNLKRAVIGLSGGLDSTICSVLLADALGKKNVFGISMPSQITSAESKSDAKELAENLGINFIEASIKPMYETTNECLNNIFKKVEKNWNYRYKQSFTSDNIQARSRAIYLWGVANEFESCIPIATSDKSELYMGYATINGDMSGGFAPIADVTKTKLFALARWINKNRTPQNVIPESIILKRPGAELAIDPNTGKPLCAEDALMPYEFLDEIIWRIENNNESYKELLETTFIYENKVTISKNQKIEWLDKFYKRMSFALYKGSILPPSVLVDSHSINKVAYYQPITSSRINYNNYKNMI